DGCAIVNGLGAVARVRSELPDSTVYLSAHVDNLFRLNGARGADRRQQGAALHYGRTVGRRRLAAIEGVPAAQASAGDGQDQQHNDKYTHGIKPLRRSMRLAPYPALAVTPRTRKCSKCCRN